MNEDAVKPQDSGIKQEVESLCSVANILQRWNTQKTEESNKWKGPR